MVRSLVGEVNGVRVGSNVGGIDRAHVVGCMVSSILGSIKGHVTLVKFVDLAMWDVGNINLVDKAVMIPSALISMTGSKADGQLESGESSPSLFSISSFPMTTFLNMAHTNKFPCLALSTMNFSFFQRFGGIETRMLKKSMAGSQRRVEGHGRGRRHGFVSICNSCQPE